MLNHLMVFLALASLMQASIVIEPSGVVDVTMSVYLSSGLNAIPLPVEPIVSTVIVNESGKLLIPVYQNGTLYVFASSSGIANVSYVANISCTNNEFTLFINANYTYKLVISSNIVLLTLPKNIINVSYVNGSLVLWLKGPQEIKYVVRAVTTTTSTTSTSTTTIISTTTTRTTTTTTTSITTTSPPVTTTSSASTTTTSTITTTPITTSTITRTRTTARSSTTPVATSKPPRSYTVTTSIQSTTASTTLRSLTTAKPSTSTATMSAPISATVSTTMHTATSGVRTVSSSGTTSTVPRTSTAPHTSSRSTPKLSKSVSVSSSITKTASTSLHSISRSSTKAVPLWIVGVAVGLVLAGISVGLALRRRSAGAVQSIDISSELSPLDKDILEVIASSGGSILQSELQRRLGVPKTTLWRHLRKLERLGIVKIVKEGGYNKVVLVRK